MRQANFYMASTLGLHLLAVPLGALAQVAGDPGEANMFTEAVQTCLAAPEHPDCVALTQMVAECAIDLDYALCAPLFEAPAAVFDYPSVMQHAQSLLIGDTTISAAQGDAPRLVVEVAGEDFRTAPDPAREPDAAEARALEQAMTNPDVAAALARFEGRRAAAGGESVYPQALFALQRAQQSEGATDGASETIDVIEGAVDTADLRSSRTDFATRAVMVFAARQADGDGGAELARAGLGSLARLAVGMEVDGGQIVARSDERVVISRTDADEMVWRDDDAILRQEQSQRWIEVFEDGSTLTRWHRVDGSWTVSIRDVTGRTLWRERILADGSSVSLINDPDRGTEVDLTVLPETAWRELRLSERTDPSLAIALLQEAEEDARVLGRTFTLRQVRETRARECHELCVLIATEI